MRVNRILHQACNDRLVFKFIIDNRRGHEVPNWDCTSLSIDAPTSIWARYALAGFKAASLATGPLTDGFVRWAPQLVALNRKINSGESLC